jgi:aminopeptidase
MHQNFDHLLDQYASVIVRVGLNIQPGQRLLIGVPIYGRYGTNPEHAPLVRRVVQQAYQAGARLVDVLWHDDQHRLIRVQHAPPDTLDAVPEWRAGVLADAMRNGDAALGIFAENPTLLAEQDPALVGRMQSARFRAIAEGMGLLMHNRSNWSVTTAPLDGWSQQVYPELPSEQANAAFWDDLFRITRADQPDPLAAWRAHIRALEIHTARLNARRYDELHLRAPGTDLRIGLPDGHVWRSGAMTSQNGINFVANIPTEEVFTLPHRERVNGTVRATLPLAYGGGFIEDFSLTFRDGRVVDFRAKQGEASLRQALDTDEGARFLGEIALVPHSSPISRTGRVFGYVLIDENAASHIALGKAYAFSLDGGTQMDDAQFKAAGGNLSSLHLDFMIGSGAMAVDGITPTGESEPIMRGGEWVDGV